MKMRRLAVSSVVLASFVAVLTGPVWWPGGSARAALAPTIAVIPVSGIVVGQPESVAFSGQAQISSELVLDTSHFNKPPSVILIVDLSGVSGRGRSSEARYVVGGDGTTMFRQLASTDTIEIPFPFSRGTSMGTSSVRTGVASFALSFDLQTGAITSGTANIASPSFPY